MRILNSNGLNRWRLRLAYKASHLSIAGQVHAAGGILQEIQVDPQSELHSSQEQMALMGGVKQAFLDELSGYSRNEPRKPERLGSGLRTGLDWTGLDLASANAVPSLASAVLFIKHGLYIVLNGYSFARKSQHGRLSL